MTLEELNGKMIEISERVTRMEVVTENLFRQQDAIDKLAIATQEMALTLKGVSIQTDELTNKLTAMQDEKNKKSHTIWSNWVGIVIGALGGILINYFIK